MERASTNPSKGAGRLDKGSRSRGSSWGVIQCLEHFRILNGLVDSTIAKLC